MLLDTLLQPDTLLRLDTLQWRMPQCRHCHARTAAQRVRFSRSNLEHMLVSARRRTSFTFV